MKKTILTLFLASTTLLSFAQEAYTTTSASALTITGSSTIHDWTVTANTLQGTLKVDENILKEISFEVAVEGIISERGTTMDKKTHNALKKEEHPNVIFLAEEIEISSTGNQNISGKLNIAGAAKKVAIKVGITRSTGKIRIQGEKKITLQDFDIEPPTAMFGSIVVGDDVTIKFDLIFKTN